jgi:Matrixin
MRHRWRLCVLLAMVIALCAAGPASAYRFAGTPWPGHTITYFNAATSSASAVNSAVYTWNTSGANLRFVAVPKSVAEVVIVDVDSRNISDSGLLGVATTGYVPRGMPAPNINGTQPTHGAHVWLVRPSLDGGLLPIQRAQVVAHELGHVLGLGHESRGCAIMNPALNELCPGPERWKINCRVLQRDDVAGAIALYGGHLARPMPSKYCDLAPKPAAPMSVVATALGHNQVQLNWVNPPGNTLGEHATISQLTGRPTIESYTASGNPGTTCPAAGSHGASGTAQEATAGEPDAAVITTASSGEWCFTIAMHDFFGRLGTPAHVIVYVRP